MSANSIHSLWRGLYRNEKVEARADTIGSKTQIICSRKDELESYLVECVLIVVVFGNS